MLKDANYNVTTQRISLTRRAKLLIGTFIHLYKTTEIV